MRLIFFIALIGLGVTGCSRKAVPVSSVTEKSAITSDSSVISTKKKDSTYYKETLTEKTIAAATVGITLSPAQFDSLHKSLSMAPGVTRNVYLTDKTMSAQLAILMDSIGNLHFKCTSLGKTYFEKDVQRGHYIETLVQELTAKNNEVSLLRSEVNQMKKGFFERVGDWIQNFALNVCLVIIVVGVVVMALRRIPFIKKLLS